MKNVLINMALCGSMAASAQHQHPFLRANNTAFVMTFVKNYLKKTEKYVKK
jgi:hypothetical protein